MKKTTKLISTVLAVITISSLMTCSTFAESTLRSPTKGKDTSVSSKVETSQGKEDKVSASSKGIQKSTATEKKETTLAVVAPSRDPADYPLLNISELIIVDWETPSTIFMELSASNGPTTIYFYANKGKKEMSYLGETVFDEAATKAYLVKNPNKPWSVDSRDECTGSMQELLDEFNGYRGVSKERFSTKNCLSTMESPPSSRNYKHGTTIPPSNSTKPSAASNNISLSTYVDELVKLTNQVRNEAGKSALEVDDDLMEAAQVRAEELAEKISHTRPNGKRGVDMIKGAGYGYAGENLTVGNATPDSAMNSWMKSSGHNENMMTTEYTAIGVGCYQDENGRMYWVQLFGG